MKEYMLLIRNEIDHQAAWTAEKHDRFVKECMEYIDGIKKAGKLLSAQPMVREGILLSRKDGIWKEMPFNESKEVIVGYYHVLANDIDDAVSIAMKNPEFAYGAAARIEVRPIQMKDEGTKFVYPTAEMAMK